LSGRASDFVVAAAPHAVSACRDDLSGWIATLAGWYTTEIGRQPWLVQGVLTTRQAVAEADAVVFVVDVRGGLSAQDHDIAAYLRTAGKKVVLAANKAEGMQESPLLGEFYELGLGDPHPISSAHGQGIRSLVALALDDEPVGGLQQTAVGRGICIAGAARLNAANSRPGVSSSLRPSNCRASFSAARNAASWRR